MGGVVDETDVCLAVYGEDLEPDEVTKALGREPSSSHRRGDKMKSGKTTWRKGAWLLSVRGEADPEALTLRLLDGLSGDEQVWAGLAARYVVQLRYGLFLGEWNQGLELSAELIARVARMHAVLLFDIYGSERAANNQ